MSSAATPSRPHRPLFAIGLRLVAVICLAVMFVTGRVADAHGVHLVETLVYRQALALPVVFAWLAMSSGIGAIRTRRISVHATRMVIGLTGMALNFLSYILLPPAEATTIGFTMPIFGTILSALTVALIALGLILLSLQPPVLQGGRHG